MKRNRPSAPATHRRNSTKVFKISQIPFHKLKPVQKGKKYRTTMQVNLLTCNGRGTFSINTNPMFKLATGRVRRASALRPELVVAKNFGAIRALVNVLSAGIQKNSEGSQTLSVSGVGIGVWAVGSPQTVGAAWSVEIVPTIVN